MQNWDPGSSEPTRGLGHLRRNTVLKKIIETLCHLPWKSLTLGNSWISKQVLYQNPRSWNQKELSQDWMHGDCSKITRWLYGINGECQNGEIKPRSSQHNLYCFFFEMLGFFCLHTPLSHEESPGFQDSPTLIGNAFRHWKLGSRLLRTSKSDPLPSNRLATLQITFCKSVSCFFITTNLNPALDSFIVISCTVECTLGEQIVFRLKTENWTIQNWGPCSCAQAMTLPTPLPSKNAVQKEPLEMTGRFIQTVSPFWNLRTSNASECTRVRT